MLENQKVLIKQNKCFNRYIMYINLQPTFLQDDFVKLVPLKQDDFEKLYAVASDPQIWEQHPTKNRYERDVFQNYFDGAVASKSAFIIYNATTNEIIGSSRFYDFDETKKCIAIGYTFLAKSHWGTTFNRAVKLLMLNYAFTFANEVVFHIGANNIRSQKAIAKLGVIKIGEEEIAYYGEQSNQNFIYKITKEMWQHIANNSK